MKSTEYWVPGHKIGLSLSISISIAIYKKTKKAG